MQLPLFNPASEWKPPNMGALPSWAGAKRISIDAETHDQHLKTLGIGVRRGAYAVGYGFTIEDGPTHYLPMRHQGGDNLDPNQVLAYLRAQAKEFKGELVGANLSYDLDYLWEENIMFPQVTYYRDVQIADPIINELHDHYSLKAITERHGLPGKDERVLQDAAKSYGVNPKSGLWKLPARFVGPYCEQDTRAPLPLLRRQERIIDERDLWDVYNLESQVLPVLVRMRRRGVRVDMERLARVETWTLEQEKEASDVVFAETGIRIDVDDFLNTSKVAPALKSAGIVLGKTDTGAESVDRFLLAQEKANPVAAAIHKARKVNKIRTTFAASIRRYIVNGRIHCSFNQIAREDEKGQMKGVRYGRLSSTDPNMQQQPSPDKEPVIGKMWRSIFLPEEGALWNCNDYSQQEPRWTTHYAAEMDLPGAREAAQAYHDDPNIDNHSFMTTLVFDITKDKVEESYWKKCRNFAKCIYLGLCYGEGGGKLCHDLGLPTRWALSTGGRGNWKITHFTTRGEALEARKEHDNARVWEAAGEEGQAILDKFDSRAPFIRKLAKAAQKVAERRGYIMTGGGRHLHFPQRDDGSYDWAHKALNRIIQGTSADQMKKSLVVLDAEGYFVQLQVHDEEDGSVGTVEEAYRKAAIMRDVMPARVPFRVDVEIGPSWGELKKAA